MIIIHRMWYVYWTISWALLYLINSFLLPGLIFLSLSASYSRCQAPSSELQLLLHFPLCHHFHFPHCTLRLVLICFLKDYPHFPIYYFLSFLLFPSHSTPAYYARFSHSVIDLFLSRSHSGFPLLNVFCSFFLACFCLPSCFLLSPAFHFNTCSAPFVSITLWVPQ